MTNGFETKQDLGSILRVIERREGGLKKKEEKSDRVLTILYMSRKTSSVIVGKLERIQESKSRS